MILMALITTFLYLPEYIAKSLSFLLYFFPALDNLIPGWAPSEFIAAHTP